ncbi:hypothetical protein [Spirosoma sp.]|uniref:hypothetical protein n=1 Tax=Spirosoma sp. TaxID=1899569 RepID=UPI002609ACDF|nr:hypothetical protein [Spirosoma sp.]MCX6217332.1 hypothetical protein [Spirosoma sp.]
MKTYTAYFVLVALLLFGSCDKKDSLLVTDKTATHAVDSLIMSIGSGTVLGNINATEFRHELAIKKDTLTYQVLDRDKQLVKRCVNPESSTDWLKILASVDFEAFKKIPTNYCTGCPALGDIGYEWIEIKRGTESHTIQFGTGSDVKEITDLLILVRTKRAEAAKFCP